MLNWRDNDCAFVSNKLTENPEIVKIKKIWQSASAFSIFIFVKKKHLTPTRISCMITKVIEMEKFVEQSLLYDFYGELLTEHQKRVFEDVVLNDYSLSEVAQDLNISRQGVHDMVKRCNKILEDYESKLHLVERFIRIREKVNRIHDLTGDEEIKSLAHEILEEL